MVEATADTMVAEAINRTMAMVGDTVPRLHHHMAADNIRGEVVTEEATRAKIIGSHHHRAAMIVDTEGVVAATIVVGDMTGDMETTKGTEMIVVTVVEALARSSGVVGRCWR